MGSRIEKDANVFVFNGNGESKNVQLAGFVGESLWILSFSFQTAANLRCRSRVLKAHPSMLSGGANRWRKHPEEKVKRQKKIAAGPKGHVYYEALAARLKSCPDTFRSSDGVRPQPVRPNSFSRTFAARLKSCPGKRQVCVCVGH